MNRNNIGRAKRFNGPSRSISLKGGKVKRLIVIASAKGGMGKSFLARGFTDAARRAGRRVSAWDLDGATGSFALLYADRDPEVGVACEDMRDSQGKLPSFDAIFSDTADDVVYDVPGGKLDELVACVPGGEKGLLKAAASAGREVVIPSLIGVTRDQVASAQDAVERFGDRVHHVVVKNLFFGQQSEFVVFDGFTDEETGEKQFGRTAEMCASVGAEVVFFPKLDPATSAVLDLNAMSFAKASEAIATLGRRHAFRALYWLDALEEALAGTWLSSVIQAPKERRPLAAAS
jgi:hypothetical protein